MKKNCKRHLALVAGMVLVGLMAWVVVGEQIETGTEGMVATAHQLASDAGAEILAAGGNAVDAAVAAAFAITVVEPNASSLGGEGFMLLSLADGRDIAIDYRSVAPGRITHEDDNDDPRYGPESTCVPGVVAGLALALEEYGTMALADVMAPAIKLARDGFPLDEVLKTRISDAYEWMSVDPIASAIYLPDGLIPETGTIIVQSDLANALELIALNGPSVFYRGEIALAIAEATEDFLSYSDLQRYAAIIRTPVLSEYRGYEVIGTPPNVAGITVAEALNIIDNFDFSGYTWSDPQAIHVIAEALKLASADRLPYDADPDFFDVPLDGLLSEEYASARASLIDLNAALMPTRSVPAGDPYLYMGVGEPVAIADEIYSPSTTQLSILDKAGNAVSITQTLSDFWGARVMVPGYGFFINDELHNFNNFNPDNLTDVNVHEPFKRPRTVIAPTIVRDPEGEVFLVVGTPGAGYIPSTVVEMIVNVIDFGMALEDAIRAPKFCSRVSYKELRLEGGYPQETLDALAALGHTVKTYGEMNSTFGGINAILVEDGVMTGVGSFRRDGGAATP
ncbi:MAG: gamma-glutamyltransferase [Candidatus Atribacteria bacterium]|nr:MAG: gamma-glutamyltransferase [Candidatus Atribacteria bacterium]